ncbi:hypothetical protein BU14_0138s0009 [Porphyra umbilicalis]|uniref:Pherophorin domain-containing protein n=1 Tax=Porphyra umbilicalis TaxID=2786 RepID=A0A1X6PAJ9_PORUM|nr:hypothetical protein BU14_0138s0009 [Porphyra umbilicalis]|eukprot:OSX77663.1 hypothetical protein BU14_0138s0009 [Porphyra umbilicalis]
MVFRALCSAATATTATAVLLGAVLSGVAPAAAAPASTGAELPTTDRWGLIPLPGCEAETQRFIVDYIDKRCLPDSSTPSYVYEFAKTTLEIFKDVEKANCATTSWQRWTLANNIQWLMAAGTCGAPYTSIPEYDAGAYTCHTMSGCSDLLDEFEEDFVKHRCVPKGNNDLDEFAKSLLEVFKLVEKDNCCVVRSQKRRLAADLAVLGSYSHCGGFSSVSRFAAAPPAPPALAAGGDGAAAAVAAPTARLPFADAPSAVGGRAAVGGGSRRGAPTAAVLPSTSVRLHFSFENVNPGDTPTGECCGGFPHNNQCCSKWCGPVAAYLSALVVTTDDCCVAPMLWPKSNWCGTLGNFPWRA